MKVLKTFQVVPPSLKSGLKTEGARLPIFFATLCTPPFFAPLTGGTGEGTSGGSSSEITVFPLCAINSRLTPSHMGVGRQRRRRPESETLQGCLAHTNPPPPRGP